MNKNVKKLFIKGVVFLLILVLLDNITGRIVRYAFFRQTSGKYYRMTKSFEDVDDSLLIMGSSHAVNHFYPEIIEKQTGLSCYNAGVEGQRLLFVSFLEQIILQRYHPEILVLNIEPYYLVKYSRAYNMLVDLFPYYFKYPDILEKAAEFKSPYEKYKLKSVLYQYSSSIAYIIYYMFHTQEDDKGFIPLYGTIPEYQRKSDIEKDRLLLKNEVLDNNFIDAFIGFIDLARKSNVKLVFVLSPISVKSDISGSVSYKKIKEIAKKKGIPILDYYNSPLFLEKYELFDAKTHLNIKGAKKFSKVFSEDLLKILNMTNQPE